jgi:hypothetical protein
MATQQPYGWRVPLDSDRPAGGRQIRELAEDVAATIGQRDKQGGAYAVAQGTVAGGPTGPNTVNMASLVESVGTPPWTLAGGALVAPLTGLYLVVYWASVDQAQSHVWVGPSGTEITTVAVSGVINEIALEKTVVRRRTAGQSFEKPIVYGAPNPVGAAVRITAAYLGNPA